MTVIEYLRRPEAIRQEIARKTVRVRVLRRHAQRITAAMRDVRVKSTPDPARMQAFLSEAADEEKAIAGLQQELAQVLDETAIYLSFLPQEQMEQILELRYLAGMEWKEIARLTGYFLSSVYRLHTQALRLLPPPPEVPDGDQP